jgi:hypothetical protein
MYSLKSYASEGSIQVWGKNLNSLGNLLRIFVNCFPKLFFRASMYIPGKWFTFWCSSIIYCRTFHSTQHFSWHSWICPIYIPIPRFWVCYQFPFQDLLSYISNNLVLCVNHIHYYLRKYNLTLLLCLTIWHYFIIL